MDGMWSVLLHTVGPFGTNTFGDGGIPFNEVRPTWVTFVLTVTTSTDSAPPA